MEKVATWTWGEALPVLNELNVYLNSHFDEYGIYELFLFAERIKRLPKGFEFSQLIWLALKTLAIDPRNPDIQEVVKSKDAFIAAQLIALRSHIKADPVKLEKMLLGEIPPRLSKKDWLNIAYYLIIPVDLMRAAVKQTPSK